MLTQNGTIYVCREAIGRLTQHADIPVKYAMPIARFARKMGEEIGLIEGQRNALIRKYGSEKEDKPGEVSVLRGEENWPQFVAEHNELMEMESELDVAKVQIPDNVTIPMDDLIALDPFIEIVEV